jgi:hypothetical protein
MSLLLSNVIAKGLFAARPAASINGRIYCATDAQAIYRDNGVSWETVIAAGGPSATLSAVPGAAGDFTIAHGLGFTPTRIQVLMTSSGGIWAQTPLADSANINLVASDDDVTATIYVFA